MIIEQSQIFSPHLLDQASNSVPDFDIRYPINQPTGRFFYDPWAIRDDLKDSVFDKLLSYIPEDIGEARIVKLKPGTCYRSHSDLDDRWHLSLLSKKSFLINLDTCEMHQQAKVPYWELLDAGCRHSAANFSGTERIQLVVRRLLRNGDNIVNPLSVSLSLNKDLTNGRYIFDDIVSPWLNKKVKQGLISDFSHGSTSADFTIDSSLYDELIRMSSDFARVTLV